MANIQLDYSDIIDIFKEKLSVDNIVKKIKKNKDKTKKTIYFISI